MLTVWNLMLEGYFSCLRLSSSATICLPSPWAYAGFGAVAVMARIARVPLPNRIC